MASISIIEAFSKVVQKHMPQFLSYLLMEDGSGRACDSESVVFIKINTSTGLGLGEPSLQREELKRFDPAESRSRRDSIPQRLKPAEPADAQRPSHSSWILVLGEGWAGVQSLEKRARGEEIT
ncbi:unnamed protein product [Pleuronectes platessa]|uniref:Uncharacterized protein n=1 Tax=Pleuronectes platessa TaxID=8262 RepID=A0A9N7U7X7_PLEPL|nr:unnamed protein product [Pleuronectes platessa]